jgi:uncharacterized protein YjbK
MKDTITNIEKEYKILLSKEQYDLIDKYYNWDNIITQVNYYYDTHVLSFAKNNTTIRVRMIDNKYKLQIKSPNSVIKENFFVMTEQEQEIKAKPETLQIDGQELYNVGTLTTLRKTKTIDKRNIIICLDKSDYCNIVEYELEIEFEENTYRISEILSAFNLQIQRTNRGKRERLFKTLGL